MQRNSLLQHLLQVSYKMLTIICLEFQKKNYIDESSDGFSEEDEEDQKDYRLGGYHPVEVFFSLFFHYF